ncbi:DNA sulfur modification protein DndD [Nodosilinea sp. FACHB-131]|uniref:DNA sulfur modification protein DndD n=1 Tax=Cyanophyceae TaxID=3028117 RepID=UPI001681FA03|nr:DNA sulfur modification protein DndD [Nodosilinea sp. FACHB-131]MBD1876728.1 DNA sulfur modification protein DndD [Nodosilinea sp. FACHB-131]
MIFQTLILQNFGPYGGRHRLNLRPDTAGNASRPIILIGGLNGGGKTTLMDALRLVLYGQRAQCSTRGSLAYADFLNQCRNRQAEAEPTLLELVLEHTLNNAPLPTEFRIRRQWGPLQKNGRDTLEVYQDGQLAEDLIKGWDERIEALLPLGISNLFLFDGEQVAELAEQDELPPGVVQAMRSLLGLELPERLDADLDVLITRKRKQLAQDNDLQKIEAIEAQLNQLTEQKGSAKQVLASLTNKKEWAERELQQAQDKFLAEGGKIAAEQAQLEAKRAHLATDLDHQQSQLRDLAAGSLPLALIEPLLTAAQTQAHDEVRHRQYELTHDLLTEQNQALLEFAQTSLGQKSAKQIQAFLEARQASLAQPETGLYLDAESSHLHQLEQTLSQTLPNQHRQTKAHLKASQQRQAEIEALDRYLASSATEEIYEKLSQQVKAAQTKLAQLATDYAKAEQQLNQVNQALDRTKKDLQTYSQLAIDFKNTDHLLKSAAKVKQTLALFKQKLKLHKLNHLEDLVTKHFLYLLRKPDFVHRVQIDTETFRLALYDHNGELLPKHRLSAGEKQILAIALLWGLANASGRQLPVAIDTPLGRLDSEHRNHLVDRYFPQASHQVILLSTDTEIRAEEVERLRGAGAIAREYRLEYDPKQRQTAVVSGYFW